MSKNSRKQVTEIVTVALAKKPFASLTGFFLSRCRNLYYKARESFGQHKRDIVVVRVEDARDRLEDAKLQFECALEKFSEITNYRGGPLNDKYRQLKYEFEHSKSRADAVRDRIRAVEEVAEALFLEWEDELEVYTNRTLRNSSRQQLMATRRHYGRLMKAMKRAEAKINPVMDAFQDHVLYLKHNLNAQAIAALQNELVDVGIDIATLIKAMERSITEATAFMNSLNGQRALPNL
ncbi:MAG: DUF2959 domain-containing protein [Pseudomonadota bacterium]